MVIAQHAPDRFGRLLAFGFTALLGLQASINMGVVVGVLPTKGITLPLVSFGGTALVTSMFLVGVLINIGMRRTPRAITAALPRTSNRRRPTRVTIAGNEAS